MGDAWEMHGRCRGGAGQGTGEVQGRYRRESETYETKAMNSSIEMRIMKLYVYDEGMRQTDTTKLASLSGTE